MTTKKMLYRLSALILCAFMAALPGWAQKQNRPSPALTYNIMDAVAGDGYMVAGDLWHTVKPLNTNEANRLNSTYTGRGMNSYMHIGGNNANWLSPSGNWPSGYGITNVFRNAIRMTFPAFESSGWPGYGPGNPVRALDQGTDAGGAGGTSRFMFAVYGENLQGAGDPTRDYQHEARFTDAARRHMVYEAGWPTTAGIDFKIRAHQYTPNHQNLNDFIVLEVTMTNTGVVDSDGDGTPEATGHAIDAVAIDVENEAAASMEIGRNGDRGGNRGLNLFGAGRTNGYVATPDATGAPYDMWVWFANVPPSRTANQTVPPTGQRDFGINSYSAKEGYTDVWNTMKFLGVKQGSIEDNLSASSPDKETLFGTHPIGQGPRRGWYASTHNVNSLVNDAKSSDLIFRSATATWYQDYGKTSTSSANVSLGPNPNFFLPCVAPVCVSDDVTTFIPDPTEAGARPNGDRKYAHQDIGKTAIEQPVWEPAWNPNAATDPYAAQGYTFEFTFGQAQNQGVGPFSLDVGESITVVWTTAAGYRFEGVADAVNAANWAWANGWDISSVLPVPPAPEMNVESTPAGTAIVRWSDMAATAAATNSTIDGYKIWRASQYKRTRFEDAGFRLIDRFQEQHAVGASTDALLDPINPLYTPPANTFSGNIQGSYQPAEWGTYELLTIIPNAQLQQFADATAGYDFALEDTEAITGFTYWYYVSAYDEGSFSGPLGAIPSHLESASINRNGRNATDAPTATVGLGGLWGGTYPFADLNPAFPRVGTQAYKNIGAPFTVTPPVAAVNEVANLVTVSPNPYKITGLNDVRNDPASHDLNFLNMPADFTLTIMDVAGQVIYRTTVTGAPNGKFTWDMFSKDGVEVSSGLYIYHLQYGNGQEHVGHFAILR